MARFVKRKKSLSAIRDSSPSRTPAVKSQEPPTATIGYEKERVSLLLSSELARAIRRQARDMGVSFNAFMSSAAYDKLNARSSPSTTPSPHAPVIQHVTNVMPRSSQEKTPEEKLAKFGKFWRGDPDPDGGGRPTASWDDCVRYDRMVKQMQAQAVEEGDKNMEIPNYEIMAKRLGFTRQVGLACAIAYDDSHYTDYMDLRYGPGVWDNFLELTKDVA